MNASFILLLLCPALIAAANLPGGIKKCKNDETLNDCIQKQSKAVTNALSKGDPKFGIPVVDPLFIPKIQRTQGGNKGISLNLTLENINIYGFGKSEIIKTEFDTSKKFLKLTFRCPTLRMLANYDLNGKFLVVYITGKGNATVDMENVLVESTITYKLEKKKGGAEYAIINPKPILSYTTTKASYHLDNLFNGDKALGDATNKMINENWLEFNNELGPGVAQGIGQVYGLILSKVASTLPYKDLFA